MATEKFCLRWNDFESNISTAFRELRDDKDFFDVTLACEDEQIQAHKVILSACSPFFRGVLRRNPHAHPLLYLKGVKFTDLQSVLSFMYHGEVNVAQEELNSFLAVAEELRVKGLTQNNQSNSGASSHTKKDSYSAPRPAPPPAPRIPDRDPVPPPQKKRNISSYAPSSAPHEDDDIQEVMPTVKTEPIQVTPTIPPEPYHPQEPGGQLQQVDDGLNYDDEEGYEDYGQYGAEEGGYEGTLVDADGNKGPTFVSDIEAMDLETACEKYLQRGGPGNFVCLACGKSSISYSKARNHLEAKHFPSAGYTCDICNQFCKTRHGLECHRSRNHQNRN